MILPLVVQPACAAAVCLPAMLPAPAQCISATRGRDAASRRSVGREWRAMAMGGDGAGGSSHAAARGMPPVYAIHTQDDVHRQPWA